MPVQVSYPGVYVQEVPSGVRTITGVSTSVAMFIGMAGKGPLGEPRRVLSFTDYARTFGADASAGEMPDQARQFFLNGGRQAWVIRIADGALAARASLQNEFGTDDVLTLEARSAGAIGGTVRIQVDYDTSSPEVTFNLTIFREEADASGTPQVVESETFKDLTMRPGSARNVLDVLRLQSALVVPSATQPTPPAPVQGFSIAGVLMDAGGSGVAELNNVIAAADSGTLTPKGRFQISVDGSPFVTAEIAQPADATAPSIAAAIEVPVNAALGPTGKSVSVSVDSFAGFNVLRFESNASTSDGSVRIAPSSTKDIAVGMQMGVGQGGVEVDAYAVQRPAPNGLFSSLGSLGPPPANLTALAAFVAADPSTVTSLQVTDSTGVHAAPLPSWPGLAGAAMARGSLTGDQEDSMRNVQENLDYLVRQINASTSTIPWTAKRNGLRVILVPEFGGPDADSSASLTTAGGTDLGASGQTLGEDPNVHRYRLAATLPGNYQTGVQDGFDGAFPKLIDYQNAFPVIEREVDLFNLMVLPRATGQGDSDRTQVWPPASAFCQSRRAFLLVDPKSAWIDVDAVSDAVNGVINLRIGLIKDHSALYWPRLRINAPEGGERTVDPSGSIAGLAARIDSNRGVWKAPAGIEADIRGVRGVEHAMSDAENGLINPEAVNAIRVFPNGIVSWGARTMDGFDNSGNDDYKYVPVRRLALFIEESLYRGLKFAVFEPNDEPLWAQIRLAAGAFMNNLFRQGAFQGQKASDAYFVKVDSETTTQNDINLGIVNVVVGFAPLKPAEFVIITIQQKAGQVQV
jgi:phage tail sheath protein FI